MAGRDWALVVLMRTPPLEVGLQSAQLVACQAGGSLSFLELDVRPRSCSSSLELDERPSSPRGIVVTMSLVLMVIAWFVVTMGPRKAQCYLRPLLGDTPGSL